MGLNLRFCLFYDTTPEDVWRACAAFYSTKGVRLVDEGDDYFKCDLHSRVGDWVGLTFGDPLLLAEWSTEAQQKTSEILWCKSLVLFVVKGDYWGYQLCDQGKLLDRFAQSNDFGPSWFPDPERATGNPALLAKEFPWLTAAEVAPYLIKMPRFASEDFREDMQRLDIRVRSEDEFTRFHECAIHNFLRLMRVELFRSMSVWRRFWIEGRERFRMAESG